MISPSDFPAKMSKDADRAVVFCLSQNTSGHVFVHSCNIGGAYVRTNITLSDATKIDAVLTPDFSQTVKQCLSDVGDRKHDLSLPDTLFETPGLSLCDARVTTTGIARDRRFVDLHFAIFLGSIDKVFKADIGLHPSGPRFAERLAAMVLADICLPILNAHRMPHDAEEASPGRPLSHRVARARTLEFQIELLKRFVLNLSALPDIEVPYDAALQQDPLAQF